MRVSSEVLHRISPIAGWLLALAGVGILVFNAAFSRHIHVDEFHNVFSMQLMGKLGLPDYADPAEIYHVIFSWVTAPFSSTREIFSELRGVFGGLFLGLLLSIALLQPFFPTNWGRVLVFIGISLWWPAWRHGFEIRHDAFLALGVVALYRIGLSSEAQRRLSVRLALSAGWVAAWMQLNSHKAIVLWAPALSLIVGLLAWRERREAVRAVGWLAAGVALGVATGFGLFQLRGALGAYFAQLEHFSRYAADAERFSSLPLLEYMLSSGLVLSSCALGFVAVSLVSAVRGQLAPHQLTTLGFLLIALLGLALNPVPYPYNMIWATPAVLLAGVGGAHQLLTAAGRWRAPLALLLLGGSAQQFFHVRELDDYSKRSWDGQLRLVDATEALTAEGDPIFDGVGLVCTRPPANRDWLLHSVFMAEYRSGRREQLRDVVMRTAPPVIVAGHYRTGWLSESDQSAVRAHYVPLSQQLWVLGADVPSGESQIQILRAGRYLVNPSGPQGLVRIDGRELGPEGVLRLELGLHTVAGGARIAWLGPHLNEAPVFLELGGPLFGAARLLGQ